MGKQHTKSKKMPHKQRKNGKAEKKRQATFFHFSVQSTFFKCIPPCCCSNDKCSAYPAVVYFSSKPGLQKKFGSMSKALHSIHCSMQFDKAYWGWRITKNDRKKKWRHSRRCRRTSASKYVPGWLKQQKETKKQVIAYHKFKYEMDGLKLHWTKSTSTSAEGKVGAKQQSCLYWPRRNPSFQRSLRDGKTDRL